MRTLTDVLIARANGDTLSDSDISTAIQKLRELTQAMVGHGPMFTLMSRQLLVEYDRLTEIARSRNLDTGDYEICPHCGGQLKLPDAVLGYISQYGNSKLVATLCCKRPVRVSRMLKLKTVSVKTNATEDDWGTQFSKVCEVTDGTE